MAAKTDHHTRGDDDDSATPITGTYGATRARARELAAIRGELQRVVHALHSLGVALGLGVAIFALHWLVTGR